MMNNCNAIVRLPTLGNSWEPGGSRGIFRPPSQKSVRFSVLILRGVLAAARLELRSSHGAVGIGVSSQARQAGRRSGCGSAEAGSVALASRGTSGARLPIWEIPWEPRKGRGFYEPCHLKPALSLDFLPTFTWGNPGPRGWWRGFDAIVDPHLAAVADRMADHGRQVAPRRHRGAALRDIDRRRAQILTNRSGTTRGDL
jgi:hypothetical protein